MDHAALVDEMLRLPPQDRAQLIDALWQSLDPAEQSCTDRAWLSESQDRLNAYREGKLRTVDAAAALDAIEADLRK